MVNRPHQEPDERLSERVVFDEESGRFYQIKELPVINNEEEPEKPDESVLASILIFAITILSNTYVQLSMGLAALGYAIVKLFSVDATSTIILVAGSAVLMLGTYRLFREIKKNGGGV